MLNAQLKTVQIDQVKVEPTVTGKNGKPYNKVGIQTPQGWLNNIFWDGRQVEKIEAAQGSTLEVIEFEEEYNGNMYAKFKLPSRTDMLEIRLNTGIFKPSSN